MTHILMQESDILECEDFSYSEGNGMYQFCDHSEGETIRLTISELTAILSDSLAEENEEIPDSYHVALAVNILANSTYTGRARFLYNLLP